MEKRNVTVVLGRDSARWLRVEATRNDNSVFVFLRDSRDPHKQARCADWMGYLWDSRSGRISSQVLQEYYVTVPAKLDPGLRDSADRGPVTRSGPEWPSGRESIQGGASELRCLRHASFPAMEKTHPSNRQTFSNQLIP
jgi:hypothetical protein